MESDGSLPCSQDPGTDSYPKPYESNPRPQILFSKGPF
jgi:hypothetical protein